MIPNSSNPQKQNRESRKGKHVANYKRIIITSGWAVTHGEVGTSKLNC